MTGGDNALTGEVARSGLFLFENGNVGMIQQIDLAVRSSEPEKVSESGSQADLSQSINTARAVSGSPETEASLSMELTWQTEAKNFLEEMRHQIREMEKQIRRILNIESKPGNRLGNKNYHFNWIRLHGKGLTRRTGRVF